MRVDLALFDGDELLDRSELRVGASESTTVCAKFQACHQLGAEKAVIRLFSFTTPIDLKTITLDMPIHESSDWESIDLGRYTVAFWCRLDA